ncbi:hypothetical protein HO173_010873 [Letharia columbiana]|uniref:RNA helicase n=1 Tax=Letharia columbiana TaxID=112416 RepID=A0A8H6FLX5_9LECA|nr:uncharacterized protein HO173_010873 [Letharia columbiana]KAF6230965.1 hypothetical protein HO173_010873 [Letharia columbiana]
MLPADRALTSRLLPRAWTARRPTISTRCRSVKATDEKWTIREPLIKGRLRILTRQPDIKFADAATRSKLLKTETFIPWLITRLQILVAKSTDAGFVTFARNLIDILPRRSIWTALETQDVQLPSQSEWQPSEQSRPVSLLRSLRQAFMSNGESGVDTQLKYSYHGLLASQKFSKVDIENQEKLADLRYPVEWYPATRVVQRKIVLHVGPTNSGKTYHALKRLEQADTGIYAGPLRLLAHEVYTRLNAKGKLCDLITGDEKVVQGGDGAQMKSCTVEMVPLNTDVDVAVVDEIQMIGHKERGWAWTQALLGLKAKEIHLCGEERSVPLIKELAASMGDEIEIHTYKRLSPLKTMSTSLRRRLSDLRKGDCVVVFSRVGIHAMKKEIENVTQKRVAVVYGSLPPEIRAQQAKLFNDPDNEYDILVASDAIGMGLNLAIKRVIFESVSKFNGSHFAVIEAAHIKQIAGRAGRYRTAAQAEGPAGNSLEDIENPKMSWSMPAPNLGLVTTLEEADLPILRKAMQEELDPIMSAGIFPPTSVLLKFATYFSPSTSFSYILLRLHELSLRHPRYHLCVLKDQIAIADTIQPVQNLSIHDRIVFCAAPATVKNTGMPAILAAFARCVGDNSSGALLDILEIPLDILDEDIRPDRAYMERLESLHKALILYLWLSYRFAGVFINQAMAFHVKRLVEERIDKMLAEYSSSPAIRESIKKMREEALRQISKLNEPVAESDDSSVQMKLPDAPFLPEGASDQEQSSQQKDARLEERLRNMEVASGDIQSVASP